MALTDLTRISTSGIATGTSLSGAILHGDAHFRGTNAGINSAIFDSSDNALEFNDNVQLKFGNSGDLSIYHTGNNSIIRDQGTGSLSLQSNGTEIALYNSANSQYMGKFANTAQVELYYAGNKKFETTQTGTIVTGILTATGFSGPLSNPSGISTFYDLRVTNNLTVEGSTTTLDTNLIGVDRVEVGANSNSIVGVAVTQSGTADIVRLYDGASPVVTVDDVGKVGIGTDNPQEDLHIGSNSPYILLDDYDNARKWRVKGTAWFAIEDATTGEDKLKIDTSGNFTFYNSAAAWNTLQRATATHFIGLRIQETDGTQRMQFGVAGSTNHIANGAAQHDVVLKSYANLLLATNQTERLRIDSSGRVLIGTTTEGTVDSDDLTIATTGNTGMTIRSGTTHNGVIHFSDATSGVGEYAGYIDYDHNTDLFTMGANSSRFLSVDSDLVVSLGKPNFGGASRVIAYGGAGGIDKNSLSVLNPTGTVAGRGAGVAVGGNTDILGSFYAKKSGNADSAGGDVFLESVGAMSFITNGDLTNFTNNTASLTIDSSGKIGIGEDDPDGNYLLIRAASTVGTTKGHIMLTGDSATNGQGPQIVFSESGSGSSFAGAYIGHAREGSNSQGSLIFATRATSGDANTVPTERLRIMSDGEIKINHTQSSTPLNNTFISIWDANSDSSAIDASGISKNYAMISLHNYGTGVPGDTTGIGFGAGSGFSYTKGSIAFARSGSYGIGDLVFLTNNDQDTTMVNDTDERMRIKSDGVVIIGPGAVDSTKASTSGLDISSGIYSIIMGGETNVGTGDGRRNAQQKESRLGMPHYTNAEEPFGLVYGVTLSGENRLNLGGGSSIVNAATSIKFYTAGNTTTTAGTQRINIDNSAIYIQSGFPLAFLASSGATPNIKSGGTNNQDLIFTSGSGNPERFRISSSGNIAIGGDTDNVPRNLWLYNGSNDPYFRIQRGTTSDINLGGIEFASSNGNGNNMIGTIYGRATGNSATTGVMIFKARDSSSGSTLHEPLRALGKSSSGSRLMSQGNAVCVFGRHHETGGTDATGDAPTYNTVYEHSSSSYRTNGNGAFGGTFVVGGNASTWYPVWFSMPTHQDPQILSVHKYVHNYATWDGKLLFRASLMGTGYGAFAVQHRIHFFSYSGHQFVGKVIYTSHNNAYLVLWMLGGGRSYQWGTIGAVGITVNVGDDGNNHNLGPGNGAEGPITSAVTIPVGYEKNMNTSGTHQQTGFS